MVYAVEINLDYSHLTPEDGRAIWGEIDHAMRRAGFREEGRRFVAELPAAPAAHRARRAMEDLEAERRSRGLFLYRYIREFFGYPKSHVADLLAPATQGIEVTEEDPGVEAEPATAPRRRAARA